MDQLRLMTSANFWPLNRRPIQTIRLESKSSKKPKAAPCSQLKRVMNWV